MPTGSDGGRPRPSYKNPPIGEVVCGIRFSPLVEFKLPHFGLFWSKLRDDYPNVQHQAPLAADGNLYIDTASGGPIPRIWFVNQSDDELVQFQIDQLYYNWRRREKDYPRFRTIFPKFDAVKRALDDLLKELNHPSLVITTHELTYINQIAQGEGWDSLDRLSDLFPLLALDTSRMPLPSGLKGLAWNLRFDLPNAGGALDVKVTSGARNPDQRPAVVLQLSVHGRTVGASWDTTRDWFSDAHTLIVDSFSNITGEAAQSGVWQKYYGND